jgi:hypothetical protein
VLDAALAPQDGSRLRLLSLSDFLLLAVGARGGPPSLFDLASATRGDTARVDTGELAHFYKAIAVGSYLPRAGGSGHYALAILDHDTNHWTWRDDSRVLPFCDPAAVTSQLGARPYLLLLHRLSTHDAGGPPHYSLSDSDLSGDDEVTHVRQSSVSEVVSQVRHVVECRATGQGPTGSVRTAAWTEPRAKRRHLDLTAGDLTGAAPGLTEAAETADLTLGTFWAAETAAEASFSGQAVGQTTAGAPLDLADTETWAAETAAEADLSGQAVGQTTAGAPLTDLTDLGADGLEAKQPEKRHLLTEETAAKRTRKS